MGTGEMKPLVSVVMSVFNTSQPYLIQSIHSIINQTYEFVEFIIIDDGSDSEETCDTLRKIQSEYPQIRLIVNESNIGLTKSLNKAIRMCNGDYIARMDADDISLPYRLERQVTFMKDNPNIVLCGADIVGFSDGDIIFDTSMDYDRCRDPRVKEIHLVFENEGYAHPTFMLRRDFLVNHHILYREYIPHAQDYGMTTDCIINGGQIAQVEEPLLLYRIHNGQITSRLYSNQVECQARIAHSRISSTYKTLSDEECWAIARLNHESDAYSPLVYIRALKKIIKENDGTGPFDSYLFRRELRYEWYRKCMRMMRICNRPWGFFSWFSIASLPYVAIVKMRDFCLNICMNIKKAYRNTNEEYYKRLISHLL